MRNPVTCKVSFDKTRYHEHIEMCEWCRDNFGPGLWTSVTAKTWVGFEKFNWLVDSMFGNTTFVFRDPKHLTMFLLRWL